MSAFKHIPIQVERSSNAAGMALAQALLREAAERLRHLLATGEAGTIDLRNVPPLDEEGYGFLREGLGRGEVTATVQGVGLSEVQETAYPGIWWITHRNDRNDIVTEVIEIAYVPAILASQRDDMELGLARLNQALPSA